MTRPAPPHSVRAHLAITRELIRLTLGGKPARPELEQPVRDDRTQHARKTRRKR